MPFDDILAGLDGASVPKGFDRGTHRIVDPAATVARVWPLASVMGITRVANVTGLDVVGIPVVMVCRPNSRSISVSQGKGATLDAAKASGLMESVESYHAERIVAPLLLGSLEDLRYRIDLADVDGLPRSSAEAVPSHQQFLWIEGRDLLSGSSKWLPYDLVTMNYSLPLNPGFGTFVSSSNGLASGNHVLEAVSHGICEVVERHATSRWRSLEAADQARTCIDLETVHDPLCRQMLDAFRRAGIVVAVWEMTGDIPIPSFLCRIVQGEGALTLTMRPASGMGCHPVREVALLRALTEAAQSRLTFISGARDDMPREEYEFFLGEDVGETWRSSIAAVQPVRDFRSVTTWESESLEQDVKWELDRLAECGVEEVVAVDLTKPEFAIPVVKVVIPHLDDAISSRRLTDQGTTTGLRSVH